MSRIAARRRVTRLTVGGLVSSRADFLAVEEPLEIRVFGRSLAVTMRTPGNDIELAAGFLVSEGVIHHAEHFTTARYCAGVRAPTDVRTVIQLGLPEQPPSPTGEPSAGLPDEGNTYNVLDVTLAPGVAPPDPSLERNFYTTSSCGLCGKASIEAVHTNSHYTVAEDQLTIDAEMLATFPDLLRAQQAVFDRTGGLHAAALFDGNTGEMLVLREDVGRHNAVDKVVGWAMMNDRLPARNCVLMVSGRASFELTQKALMAGIPMLTAVSAPSSLAAELATDAGLTLVGFLRGQSMVIYSRPDRITNDSNPSSTPELAPQRTIEKVAPL
ncbi:formate dehydrogenase accessory sulfurtransferase FdhD [Leucobacter insecticola]|uniref:Sulfur carrier protein FdhD n=1 Tax=Leucobacter insecticola TaxID=2714934 RepID=A0A6G8FKT4_9MICO|nr:formate dehydrogenase accessory sulfurtransferase FdhD [Leucobacter insecticola]QIM16977.1 formate dehydrogenase accessory sulfurtransferase FdhD [Leucobacter insecticola]